MSWSLIVLIVVIVSLMLGPVLMLKPRPAQVRREALRLRARELGLGFGLRVPPALRTDVESPVAMPCYFIAPRNLGAEVPAWGLVKTSYSHEANFWQEWDWVDEKRPNPQLQGILLDIVKVLPGGVKAITSGSGGPSIFWDERDDNEFLQRALLILRQIQQLD